MMGIFCSVFQIIKLLKKIIFIKDVFMRFKVNRNIGGSGEVKEVLFPWLFLCCKSFLFELLFYKYRREGGVTSWDFGVTL